VNRFRAVAFASGTSTKVASCKGAPGATSCVIKRRDKLVPATTYDLRVRARLVLAPKVSVWTLWSNTVHVTTLN
jgi:hypothetical protein